MSTTNLSGKVAVITGASSGIGLAAARELHSHGMQLVLTARSADRLAQIQGELQAATLSRDITDPALPEKLLETALSTFGRCDVILNNAGMIESGPIEAINIDKVCEMVRVNVEAAYRVAYTFIRHFKTQGHGHLIEPRT
jgi:NADP-dependent 3-hydroxy acid dehydrogenase YdfG